MFKCEICTYGFSTPKSLNVHRTKKHKDNVASKKTCAHCSESFDTRDQLYRHNLKWHKKKPQENPVGNANVKCGLCQMRLQSLPLLCNHLISQHGFQAELLEKHFDSFDLFSGWFDDLQKTRKTQFHKQHETVNQTSRKIYFYCHRTGTCYTEARGIRAPREGGSVKENYHCTAFAKVIENLLSNEVFVTYCVDHYNHDEATRRLRLPEDVRNKVAEFLQDGRTIDFILDQLRSDFIDKIERKNCLTRMDIDNIQRSFGLNEAEKCRKDASSVDVWVKGDETNSFFCYHPFDETGRFMLGVMTPFQKEMIQRHGGKVICLDSTHGTNMYGYLLSTVLVIDNLGRGFPGAWFLTSNESEENFLPFFTELRERIGPLTPEFFMSDDAPAFWNAWSAVFVASETETTTKKLLCCWHVLKNWRQNLMKKLTSSDAETITTIWHTLQMLLYTSVQSSFFELLTKFFSQLEELGEVEFFNYFKTYYCKSEMRISEWALWGRKRSIINTNMHLEAFHRTLKYKFLDRKENRRVDHLLDVLMKVVRWFTLEHLVNNEKSANPRRLNLMHARHKSSLELSMDSVVEDDDGWRVTSASKSDVVYVVKVSNDNCSCKIRCRWCNICPENLSCSCPDGIFNVTACKHCHLIQRLKNNHFNSDVRPPEDFNEAIKSLMMPECPSRDVVVEECNSLMAKITLQLPLIGSDESLKQVRNKLSECFKLTKVFEDQRPSDFKRTTTGPSNKILVPQRDFEKKKRAKLTKSTWRKPTDEEREQISDRLLNVYVRFCDACLQLNDQSQQQEIDWIQCDECATWFHLNCINVDVASAEFLCVNCK